jgi:hypothetical protein
VAESTPEGTPQSRGEGDLRIKRPGWGRFGVWAHVLVLFIAVPGLALLTASADTRVFFGDNIYHADLDAFEATFTQNNNILLLLRHNGERIADSPKFADLLREATTGAWKLPHVMRVESLATHPHIVGNGDDFNVTPILDLLCPGACDPSQAHLIDDPMLRSRLVSKDGDGRHLYGLRLAARKTPGRAEHYKRGTCVCRRPRQTGSGRDRVFRRRDHDDGRVQRGREARYSDVDTAGAARDAAILVVTLGEVRTVGFALPRESLPPQLPWALRVGWHSVECGDVDRLRHHHHARDRERNT